MADIWMMLGLMLLCVAGCAAAGYWAARKMSHSVAVVSAGLIAAGMLLFGRYMSDSIFVANLLPPGWLPVFGNWQPLLAGLLVGVCWVLSKRPPIVKATTLGLLLVLSLYLPYQWVYARRPAVSDRSYRGIVMQTTGATCAPAAAATLLRSLRVPTSEQEMTELCFTTRRGTSIHGLLRGISIKLAGTAYQVKAARLEKEDLAKLAHPAILEVGLEELTPETAMYVQRGGWLPGVAHTVVAFGQRTDGRLEIGDPSTGRERWPMQALDVLWKEKIAIVVVDRK